MTPVMTARLTCRACGRWWAVPSGARYSNEENRVRFIACPACGGDPGREQEPCTACNNCGSMLESAEIYGDHFCLICWWNRNRLAETIRAQFDAEYAPYFIRMMRFADAINNGTVPQGGTRRCHCNNCGGRAPRVNLPPAP